MIQTSYDLQQGDFFDPNSGMLYLIIDDRIDLILCNSSFVSDLSFGI